MVSSFQKLEDQIHMGTFCVGSGFKITAHTRLLEFRNSKQSLDFIEITKLFVHVVVRKSGSTHTALASISNNYRALRHVESRV